MKMLIKPAFFLTLFIATCNISVCVSGQILPAKAFLKDKNVYVAFAGGSQKQLTFKGSDRDPILLLKDKSIVFIRETPVRTAYGSYTTNKIMKVDLKTFLETTLSDQKPYLDGLDGTFEILNVINPTLSLDEKFLIFGTEKYASGNQIVKVDLESGKWHELFSAESFELIKKGQFKGLFLISKSEVGSRGRDLYFKLCDENGVVKKEFDSEKSLMKFRNEIK